MRNPCGSTRRLDPSGWGTGEKSRGGSGSRGEMQQSRVLLLISPTQGSTSWRGVPKTYWGEKLAGARAWGGSECAPYHMKWKPEVEIISAGAALYEN